MSHQPGASTVQGIFGHLGHKIFSVVLLPDQANSKVMVKTTSDPASRANRYRTRNSRQFESLPSWLQMCRRYQRCATITYLTGEGHEVLKHPLVHPDVLVTAL